MRKTLMILIILTALVGAGGWLYRNSSVRAAESEAEREEATVRAGTLVAVVHATGTILPEKETSLAFEGAGRVAEVLVEEGKSIRKGDVLARLETTDLEFTVAQAELSLAAAQAELDRLLQPSADHDVAAAQAALKSAQAAYNKLAAGPSEEKVRIARAGLEQAEATLKQAQMAYDLVASRPDIGMLPQSLQLEQATIAHKTAKADLALALCKPSKADLTAAQSAIVQAEATLAGLEESVSAEDLRITQLQIEQAQLSLNQARQQLENAVLKAPHPGTITLVDIRVGELSAGQPLFLLTDLSKFHADVTVDEIDIGHITGGQPVSVTLDALPEVMLTGNVARVAERADRDSGIVTYRVTVHLDPTDAPLRVGMTTSVEIVTERREGILLIPNRFVSIDRATGQTLVDRRTGDQIQPVKVQLGLRDEFSSEVLSGLDEGDVIVLTKKSSRDELENVVLEF
jgi:HlyD family secretion protein